MCRERIPHKFIGKAKPGMGMDGAEFFMVMGREVDDHEPSIVRDCPDGFGNDCLGVLGVMQHLVENDGVKLTIADGEHVEVTQFNFNLARDIGAEIRYFCAGKPQHFGAIVQSDKPACALREQFDNAASPCTDVQYTAQWRAMQNLRNLRLNFRIGNMQRSQEVPFFCMCRKIGCCHIRASVADLVQPRQILLKCLCLRNIRFFQQ